MQSVTNIKKKSGLAGTLTKPNSEWKLTILGISEEQRQTKDNKQDKTQTTRRRRPHFTRLYISREIRAGFLLSLDFVCGLLLKKVIANKID